MRGISLYTKSLNITNQIENKIKNVNNNNNILIRLGHFRSRQNHSLRDTSAVVPERKTYTRCDEGCRRRGDRTESEMELSHFSSRNEPAVLGGS